MNGRPVRSRKLSTSAERQIRERHVRRMKQRRRRRIILRSTLIALAVAAVMIIVMFLTPIFNVKNLNIQGNSRVSVDTLYQQLPNIVGENLFKISQSQIRQNLSGIAYIEDVQVDKDYFPAEVTVVVVEKKPCAAVEIGSGYIIIDSHGAVLEEREDKPEDVPQLTFYHENFNDFKQDTEAVEELNKFFEIAYGIDIFRNITGLDIQEYNEINFQYEGKVDVICGSGLDMDKKLRLFKAVVNDPGFTTNAHGTVDLSTTGQAKYDPN